MDFKAAKCPECGGDLQVPPDRELIKCMYCAKDIVVQRALQLAAPAQVSNWMKLAETAAESGNQDEAYAYYTKVLEVEPNNPEAWFGKGEAAGWSSNLQRNRFEELHVGIEKAIECASESKAAELRKRGAEVINQTALAYFKLSNDHTAEFVALDGTWPEHIDRVEDIILALKVACVLDPSRRDVVENGIEACKALIEGIKYDDPYDTDNPLPKNHELSPEYETRVRGWLAEFAERMKAFDANYKAPEVESVGSTKGAWKGCLVIVVLLVLGGIGLLKLLH